MSQPRTSGEKCLYLVYWGATEPLGRALVLPVVEALAERGEEIFLITFDKPSDRDPALVAEIEARLRDRRVRWIDLTYHKRPRNWSTGLDIARGLAVGGYWVARHRIRIVHGRTYVGGLMAWLLGSVLPVRVVFHNDGFWPEEQVEAGVWAAGSRADRLARRLARSMYRRADGLLVLSERAKEIVRLDPEVSRRAAPIEIAPSGVDLTRFDAPRIERPPGALRLVYVGSLGGRYPAGSLVELFAVARELHPGATLRIATRQPALLTPHLGRHGVSADDLACGPVPSDEVPALLAASDVGVHLLLPGLGSAAGSPTKAGEYLAAGLPVLTTPGAGDLDRVLAETGTGVTLEGLGRDQLARGLEALCALMEDPQIAERCRSAARRYYSLERSVDAHLTVYARLRGSP